MRCPKCSQENTDAAQYCSRCHAPLRFVCPACKHVQTHGDKCEKCGVDFAKYAGMMMFQVKTQADKEHERLRQRAGFFKQILLLPITGGLSLLHYLFRGGDDR